MMTVLEQISYNYQQAFEATGISIPSLRKLVAEEKLAVRYFGRTPLIDAKSLAQYCKSLPAVKS